jgi:hypothetical protein
MARTQATVVAMNGFADRLRRIPDTRKAHIECRAVSPKHFSGVTSALLGF